MTFVEDPAITPQVEQMYEADIARGGYVTSPTRIWAHAPEAHAACSRALDIARVGLTERERGVLALAMASALGDAQGSLAWGTRVAAEVGDELAVDVLNGYDDALTEAEAALAEWARAITRDPSSVEPAQVDELRRLGFGDATIVKLTIYVSMRIAVSTVNGALGATPDAELMREVPSAIRHAVTWGRRTH